jgi:hypothetical protein
MVRGRFAGLLTLVCLAAIPRDDSAGGYVGAQPPAPYAVSFKSVRTHHVPWLLMP